MELVTEYYLQGSVLTGSVRIYTEYIPGLKPTFIVEIEQSH